MRQFLFALLTLLFISCNSSAQQKITIDIEDALTGIFELKLLKGTQQLKISETTLHNNQLIFTGTFEPGLYALLHNGKGISFIINESQVHLKSNWSTPYSKTEVINSKENAYWLNYKNQRDLVFNKLKLLHPLTINYDKSSSFYTEAQNEFYTIQKQLIDYATSVDTSTLASRFINTDLRPTLAHDKTYEFQKNDLKSKWFINIDWNDERLLNSDILTTKIDDFMGLFFQKGLSIEAQEAAFKTGIDQILDKANLNSKIKEYTLVHLVKKLEQYQMENVILHIAENHINTEESCEKETNSSEIIERLKRFDLMRIGNIAPDISGLNLKDKTISAFENATDKNLVIFWSSQCSHCRQMMPEVNKWYKTAKNNGWTLMTVSLDTEKSNLTQAFKELQLDIPVITDYKGWDSKIATTYNVSATPAMFVLNKQREIIAKPNWLSELKNYD
jgi:peroxiredoxin